MRIRTRALALWGSTGSILVLSSCLWSACRTHPIGIGSPRDGGGPSAFADSATDDVAATVTSDVADSSPTGGPALVPATYPPLQDRFRLGLPPEVMTGEGPVAIVAQDLDGDGKLDLATANQKASTVSVILGEGKGLFAAAVDYPTGPEPVAIVAGDWNRDGRIDLATANAGADTVSVLLSKKGGGFVRQPDIKVGQGLRGLEAADLDLDGILDLAVLSSGDDKVVALYGKGDGTFPVSVKVTTGPSPSSMAFGDFNRDGRPDFVTVNSDVGDGPWRQSVRLGWLEREFMYWHDLVMDGFTWGAASVTAGDFDGDGMLDLGLSDPGGRGWSSRVSAFVGAGNGEFSSEIAYHALLGTYLIKAADLNGDGRAELGLIGAGDSTIVLGQKRDSSGSPLGRTLTSGVFGGDAVAFADLDGDGKQDIALASTWSRSVLVGLGKGDGSFQEPPGYGLHDPTSFGPTLVPRYLRDFNHDGRLDAIGVHRGSTRVSLRLGKGDGTFADTASDDENSDGSFESFDVGDLNNDGNLDFVGGYYGVTILLTDNTGMVASSSELIGEPDASWPVLGDLNGDGNLDIAASTGEGSVGVWLGDGAGRFPTHTEVDLGGEQDADPDRDVYPRLADLNGDRILDLVVVGRAPSSDEGSDLGLAVALGLGDGTFGHVTFHRIDPALGGFSFLLLGDLHGDKAVDVLIGQDRGLTLFSGAGDGTVGPALSYPSPVEWWNHAELADLNGDGKLDLLVPNIYPAKLGVLLGNGDGTFAYPLFYASGRCDAIAVADLNGDHRQDVVVSDCWGPADMYVLMNTPL